MTDETPSPTTPELPTATPARRSPRPTSSADTHARRPGYRGAELDPERGPGLGCFWFQAIVLAFFIVLIPIGLKLDWPFELLAILLFVVLGLLLLTGQTVIFLLRLVAADRRAQGRRRPLASPTKTVGELEDTHRVAHAVGGARPVAADVPAAADVADADVAEPAADRVTGRGEPVVDGVAGRGEPAFGDAPTPADSAEADSDADPSDGAFVASQAMIRGDEVLGAPVEGAHDTESEAGPVADPDATDTDEATRAPVPTREGDAAVPGDPDGGGEGEMAARTHESSPGGQGLGPAAADEAGSPAGEGSAAEPAADDAAADDAAAAEAADHDDSFGPGEAPEEPDPGVRQ